jgi:hypothetical protein
MRYWLDIRTIIENLIIGEDPSPLYPWENEKAKKQRLQAEKRRYIKGPNDTKMPDYIELSPPGFCNWCGTPLPKTHRRFCPAVILNQGDPLEHKSRACANAYFNYWWTVPRWKRIVFIRDGFTCQECGVKPIKTNRHGIELPDFGELAVDHIVPVARGGKTETWNLQTLCRICNSKKRDKVPDGDVSLNVWLALDIAKRKGIL